MKHPLAEAWDKWLESNEGKLATCPDGLIHPSDRQYLENRLHNAFMAGASVQEKLSVDQVTKALNIKVRKKR